MHTTAVNTAENKTKNKMNSTHQRHKTPMCSLAKGESSSSWAETQTLRVSQGGPAQSSNPARPSIPSSSLSGNAQPAGYRLRGANTGFQVQPEPGGARDPAPVQTPLNGPRCSGQPGPAASKTRIGLRGSWRGAPSAPASTRPAAPRRAQPGHQPEPHPSAVAPPSVLSEADGRCHRRRRLPSAPIAPRLPPAPPASPRARPR